MRLAPTDRRLSYCFLATASGGAVTLRSQKSVNNNMDFPILRLMEIARIQKWLDIDFSHKKKTCVIYCPDNEYSVLSKNNYCYISGGGNIIHELKNV